MIYWRRYGADYLVKTIGFSMEMDGAFGRLLDHYYTLEGPLPLDLDELIDIARATKDSERDAVQKVLRLKFDRRADGYHNDRADAEIALARQARENGGKHVGKSGRTTQGTTGDATGATTGAPTRKPSRRRTRTTTQDATQTPQPFNRTTLQPYNPSAVHPLNQGKTTPPEASAAPRRSPRGGGNSKGQSLAERNARAAAEAAEEAMRTFDDPDEDATHRARAHEPAAEAPVGPRDGSVVDAEGGDDERAWWRDEEGVLAAAGELGIVTVEGQDFTEFKCRVLAARGPGPWMDELTRREADRVGHYQAFGVNPEGSVDRSAPTRVKLEDGREIQVRGTR